MTLVLGTKDKKYTELAFFVINRIMKKYRVTFYDVNGDSNILHIEYGYSSPFNPMYHINLDDWVKEFRLEKIKRIKENLNENKERICEQ